MTIDRGPVRVVSVVNEFPAPSETFIERKVLALVEAGMDVSVAASHLRRSAQGRTGGVRTVQLPHLRSPRTWRSSVVPLLREPVACRHSFPTLREFGRAYWLLPIAVGRYDIVHFEFSGIAAAASDVLHHLRPAKLVVSCRGTAERVTPHQDPTRRRRLQHVFDEVDLIHCVSDEMSQAVRELGASPAKIFVNRPAVDLATWEGAAGVDPAKRGTVESPLRIVSVGRLHWMKAFDDALRATAVARSAGLQLRYLIAGDGPEREKLLYLRHSLGLDDVVTLLGWQGEEQVRELFGSSDVFLLSSLSEGISNAALEAMAAGLPLLSTRCGGMEEALRSPDAGLLVDVGAVHEIAEGLVALADPLLRKVLAAGGTAAARSCFDLSRQAAVFIEAYNSLPAIMKGTNL